MRKITYDKTYCNPKDILECGQIFRFRPYKDGYIVFSGCNAAYIHENGPDAVIECDDAEYFEKFFDLDRDYEKINKDILAYDVKIIHDAATASRGIRILNQNGEEAVYSFIISQNNNIPRIKSIIERICDALGETRTFMDVTYHAFPSSCELAKKDPAFYKSLGAGYRDKYLHDTSAKIEKEGLSHLEDLSTAELKKELQKFNGVGPKVADCVALFGFHRTDSFPVDTWIEKVYREDFHGELKTRDQINAYFSGMFGDLSGIVQQYLFYAKRGVRP